MPYDPANFSFSYAHNVNSQRNPETDFATVKDWRILTEYFYTPLLRSWKPFTDSKYFDWINFNLVPSSLG